MNARPMMAAPACLVVAVLAALLALPPASVRGQGFAGLETTPQGFALPQRGAPLRFPQDHGAHPAFRTEWWYLTANLQGAAGEALGAQWTLFRTGLAPREGTGWDSPQLWMAHAALTRKDSHRTAERLARGGIGQAGVTLSPFSAGIDDWVMRSTSEAGADQLAALEVRASGEDFSYDLTLRAEGPVVPQGEGGYSLKSPGGQASHYYSQPFYRVSGTVTADGRTVAVTGQAWFDHEWFSQYLAAEQTGWDWFAFHFQTGERLMGFRLRDAGAGFTQATWIAPDGRPEPQPAGALKVTPLDWGEVEGRRVPLRWRVQLPSKGLDVTTTPLNPKSWMATQVSYWEGPVTVSGSLSGQGYVEMTGYR